ncbi:hypothetical protein EDF34_3131 [Cellulomonas sp. PhB150]|nr:hypothetical protein EDF34_3131 [Cellulomonas sp. PhB150]
MRDRLALRRTANQERSTKMGAARKTTIIALCSAFALGAVALPAEASTKHSSTTISCDGVTWKYDISVSHATSGTFKIKQNDETTQDSISKVTARSANGNDILPLKFVENGQTATWTGVLPSTYQVHARRSDDKNCNGLAPGAGNYTFDYTVTYNG